MQQQIVRRVRQRSAEELGLGLEDRARVVDEPAGVGVADEPRGPDGVAMRLANRLETLFAVQPELDRRVHERVEVRRIEPQDLVARSMSGRDR
jgi:hypothetical protein